MMSGAQAPSPEVVRGRQQAHRARQVQARIVALAQEYREACRQHEAISRELWRTDVVATSTLLDEEQRTWEGMEQRRDALFAALGELETLEGSEEQGTDGERVQQDDRADGHEGWCDHAPVGAHLCRRCHEREGAADGR